MARFKSMAEVFADPERWCQGYEARDQEGYGVTANSPTAVSWCLSGACRVVAGDDEARCRELRDKLQAAVSKVWGGTIVSFNDYKAKSAEEVYNLCKEAGI